MKRPRALLVALLVLLGLADRGLAGTPDPFEAFGLVRLDRGARAPDFTLPDLAGNPTSVTSPGAAGAIVVFWGTW